MLASKGRTQTQEREIEQGDRSKTKASAPNSVRLSISLFYSSSSHPVNFYGYLHVLFNIRKAH